MNAVNSHSSDSGGAPSHLQSQNALSEQSRPRKLVIITLQEKFLQMSFDQLDRLLGRELAIRPISLNELTQAPPTPEETILCYNPGVRDMVTRLFPDCGPIILATREILVWNLKPLFGLTSTHNILVVNDGRKNTEEMVADLEAMALPHHFTGYYPGQPIPDDVDQIVTSGERALIPTTLSHLPVIDCGIRFISLGTFAELYSHFGIDFRFPQLARRYQKMAVELADRWPVLGSDRFITPWFGATREISGSRTIRERADAGNGEPEEGKASHTLQTPQKSKAPFGDFIATSPAMRRFIDHVSRLAATDQPLHISGEIGTGKRKICKEIHNSSTRREGPFITINCTARSSENLERELFGWEDSGFAGQKAGPSTSPHQIGTSLLECAGGGTLCIEEIDGLAPQLQARLLQVLSEGCLTRTGGTTPVSVNVRIITTSSSPLDRLEETVLNSDLLLLLKRYVCRVPRLHERGEDFQEIIDQYLREQLDLAPDAIDAETIDILKNHSWKGNVQELYNVLQYMSCTSEGGMTRESLPYYITGATVQRSRTTEATGESGEQAKFAMLREEIEKHGFLTESLAILTAYQQGKRNGTTYGRGPLQRLLAGQDLQLTPQQLRLRLEKLDKLGLLIVRPGRRGTTISSLGEEFLSRHQLASR